jgi:hypothetical protein
VNGGLTHLELLGISIDRITFVGGAYESLLDELSVNPYVRTLKTAKYPYKYQWHMVDGSILQQSEKGAGIPELRFEFNPNNFENKHNDKHIMSIMRIMRDIRLTRLDIAMDFKNLDFSKCKIIDKKVRKRANYYGLDSKIETMYFGTRRSDMYIRIYNKAREQGLKNYGDSDWWRCEVQLNGDMAEAFSLINPYHDLSITIPRTMDTHDIRTRAMLHYLNTYPDAITELSVNIRPKYKELLAATNEPIKIDIAEIYEHKKRDLIEEVNMWKNLTMNTTDWELVETDGIEILYNGIDKMHNDGIIQ